VPAVAGCKLALGRKFLSLWPVLLRDAGKALYFLRITSFRLANRSRKIVQHYGFSTVRTIGMSASNHLDVPGTQPSSGLPARSLAYLISRYPTLSMIFVLREVLELRALGFRIETASINPPDRAPDQLTAEEAAEAARTYCVKNHGLTGAAKAHLLVILRNFIGYWRGLGLVFRLGGLDLKRLFFNLMYFTEALMVGQWMRRNKQKHLHVHLAQQAATLGLFVRRVFGFGFSMTVHGPDEFYDANGQYLAQKIAAADFIICISSYTRSQLMKLSPYIHWNKFIVSRLGVDAQLFSPQTKKAAPEVFEILCVGRLIPAKGQHLLMDAVQRLTQQGRRVRLRLVGDGPDESSLREQAARIRIPNCVVFEGAVNQDHIRTHYASADLFCLPSFAEGLPVVLMEAMAMGIPCVATQIAGIPELIRDGVDGLLVPPSDLEALVETLGKLMDDAALRQRLGKSGLARVAAQFDLQHSVERLAKTFAERVGK
jgi:glycosyltransferase involved in cell wall biosynthesis